MSAIKNDKPVPVSVSSSRLTRSVSVKISTLLMGVLLIVLIAASFYAGTIFEHTKVKFSRATQDSTVNRHFAIGMVVYISSSSITVDNERTGTDQQFKITPKTLISLDGSPATASQIKEGYIVLLRYLKDQDAAVILVNTSFTD